MKTINVPMLGNCPEWHGDVPPERADAFKNQVARVNASILQSATRTVLAASDLLAWHRLIFEDLVPIPYYAGNFRCDDPLRVCLARDIHVDGVPGSSYRLVNSDVTTMFGTLRAELSALELLWSDLTPNQRVEGLAIQLARFIARLIQIHPLLNGNGRISRFAWRWFLYRFGVPPQCSVGNRPAPPYGEIMRLAMLGDDRPLAYAVLLHLRANPPAQAA